MSGQPAPQMQAQQMMPTEFQPGNQQQGQQVPAKLCSQFYSPTPCSPNTPVSVRLLQDARPQKKDLRLSAVVVTICNGSSYDPVFQTVPQEGVEGTYVATYEVTGSLKPVLEALNGGPHGAGAQLDELVRDVNAVEPNAVVFNWECCSACQGESFGTNGSHEESNVPGFCATNGPAKSALQLFARISRELLLFQRPVCTGERKIGARTQILLRNCNTKVGPFQCPVCTGYEKSVHGGRSTQLQR